MQFSGPDQALEISIAADDPAGVASALRNGASVNARGAHDVTPLEFAIGTGRHRAAAALIQKGADPNLRDVEGDSSMSLAVAAYARDASLLKIVLDAGGNPNALRPDGDPVITRFLNDHNLEAITYLHSRGASLDAEVNGAPMVVHAAIGEDWDVVWHLIKLGASTDSQKVRDGLVFAFKAPELTPPDSPLYAAKVEVYNFLKSKGLNPGPPTLKYK